MMDVSVKSLHEGGPWDVRAWIGGSELPLPESSVLTSVVDMVRSLDIQEKGAIHQLGVFWRNLLEGEYLYRTSSKTVVQVYSGWESLSRIGVISIVSEIQMISFQSLHCTLGYRLYTGVDRVKCSGAGWGGNHMRGLKHICRQTQPIESLIFRSHLLAMQVSLHSGAEHGSKIEQMGRQERWAHGEYYCQPSLPSYMKLLFIDQRRCRRRIRMIK